MPSSSAVLLCLAAVVLEWGCVSSTQIAATDQSLQQHGHALFAVIFFFVILLCQEKQKGAAAQVLAKGLASMAPSAEYRVDPDGVAVITLSNPPVNALHPAGKA
jgi:hypothetical protein